MTKLTVCNAALDVLGESPITQGQLDGTAAPDRAIVLARQWEFALEELLRAAPWPFAKDRAALTAASPAPDFGWSYRFNLPTDFLTLISLNETYNWTAGELFELESGYLLTDDDEANVEYIAIPSTSATDALLTRMDPLARKALITLLASKIATKIAKDGGERALQLEGKYETSDLPKARKQALAERKRGITDPTSQSAWVLARQSSTAD